ncbi:hypothetical protein FOL47_006727 [Perkinsus chesapeaki]|uniref:Uncharacterized protein n=1 Tax=Perkinsus chesapeaki TaxID=330153 RepID=A0A7J6LQG2_PERCH|nr:hypothetical protein FOL47_006727 [Perkinsus chesapeaki]
MSYNEMILQTKAVFGELPDDVLPSLEQVIVLRSRVEDHAIPFADFSVWTGKQRIRLRQMKLKRWTFGEDGTAERISAPSLTTFHDWCKSSTIYKYALAMIGASTITDLEAYRAQIEHLYSIYGDHYGSFVTGADELLRSSRISKFWPVGDKTKWGVAFRAAAADYSFLNAQVNCNVFQVTRDNNTSQPGAKSSLHSTPHSTWWSNCGPQLTLGLRRLRERAISSAFPTKPVHLAILVAPALMVGSTCA